jgi:hypothetical protein
MGSLGHAGNFCGVLFFFGEVRTFPAGPPIFSADLRTVDDHPCPQDLALRAWLGRVGLG